MKKFLALTIFLLISLLPSFAEDEIKYMNITFFEKFNDEFLNKNLLNLYEKNYDFKNASLKIKENEQIVKMQFANELPVSYTNSYIARDLQAPRQQFGEMSIPKYTQNNYNIPLTVQYEIDLWGKNRLKTKAKKEELEAVKQEERAVYIALVSDFTADYFNLIKADKLLELQDELVNIQTKILNLAKEKYNTGLSDINSVLKEEKALAQFKKEYNLHLQTRDTLINTMKVYLADESDIKRAKFENIQNISNIQTSYSSEVVENRPDYLILESNLKSLGLSVKVARREFLPTFTIFGDIGLNAYKLNSLFKSPSQFLTLGVLPSMDLFSGGRKRAFLKYKKYQYEEALNDYQKGFLKGVMEINSAISVYLASKSSFKETQIRLKSENEIYTLAKEKENIGASSMLDTLYAKENYLMMQKENVSSKIDEVIAVIGLYKAVGGIDLTSDNSL